MADFWLPLLVKAGSTALLVVLASTLAEAAGPFWGALVVSLPISAGPAYIFLAMQHDADFIAASALNSVAVNAATGLFLLAYIFQPARFRLWQSLGLALALWLAASLLFRAFAFGPVGATVLNLLVYGAGFYLLSGFEKRPIAGVATVTRRWFDLPLRAVSVALFVSIVVTLGSVLGPAATGTLAVFPINLTSLIVILEPRLGRPLTAALAANAFRGMLGFGLMLLAFHLAIRFWGLVPAFPTALAVSLAWSAGLLALRRR